MNKERKTMLIMILAGLVAIGMSIWGIVNDRTDERVCTAAAEATILSWESEDTYDNVTETYSTSYYPVMSFEAGGETITARYSQAYGDEKFGVGEQVRIKYDPAEPQHFVVAGEHRGTVTSTWMIPLGVVLILIPVVRMIASRRKGRTNA